MKHEYIAPSKQVLTTRRFIGFVKDTAVPHWRFDWRAIDRNKFPPGLQGQRERSRRMK